MKNIKYKLYFLIIFITQFFNSHSNQPLIRYLKPPKLDFENLGDFILCHRPMRHGTPNMDIEKYSNKTIINNYGYGGSGWTLGPGCAQFIINKFNKLSNDNNINKQEHIVIIGAGALGLFTAYELVKSGWKNLTIIAEQFDNLTSHKAGGFLAPSTMEVDKEMQNKIDDICFDAYKFFSEIALGKNADFPKNASLIMPIYLKRHDMRLKTYEGKVMDTPKDIIIDFGNGKQYEMKVYDDGIYMDTNILMQALTTFLQDKVHWTKKHINSFDEIDASYIFNCSGLGAKILNNDNLITSVQGHLILLKNQNPEEMNYMISFYIDDESKTESGQSAKRSIYMFPKHIPGSSNDQIGILGGTFIHDATNETPNQKEFESMITRHREFFGYTK